MLYYLCWQILRSVRSEL